MVATGFVWIILSGLAGIEDKNWWGKRPGGDEDKATSNEANFGVNRVGLEEEVELVRGKSTVRKKSKLTTILAPTTSTSPTPPALVRSVETSSADLMEVDDVPEHVEPSASSPPRRC